MCVCACIRLSVCVIPEVIQCGAEMLLSFPRVYAYFVEQKCNFNMYVITFVYVSLSPIAL